MPFNFKTYADITGQHEEALAAQVGRAAAQKDAIAASQRQQQIDLQARSQQLQYQTHRENLMARRFAEERQMEYQSARDAASREHALEMGDRAEISRIAASDRAQAGQIEDEQRALDQRDRDDSHKASAKVADEFLVSLSPSNLEDDAEVRSQAAKIKNKINAIRASDVPRAKKDELIREVIEDNQEFVDSHKRKLTSDQRIQQSHPLGGEASEFVELWQQMNPGKEVPASLQKRLDKGYTFTYERRNGADKLVWDAPPVDEVEESEKAAKRLADAERIKAHNKHRIEVLKLNSEYRKEAIELEINNTGGVTDDRKRAIQREADELFPPEKTWEELHPESVGRTPAAAPAGGDAAAPVDDVDPSTRLASTTLIDGLDDSVTSDSDRGAATISDNVETLKQQVAEDPTNADLQDAYAAWLAKNGQYTHSEQVKNDARLLRAEQEVAEAKKARTQHANTVADQSEADRAKAEKDRFEKDPSQYTRGSVPHQRAIALLEIDRVNEMYPEGEYNVVDGKRVGNDRYKWQRIEIGGETRLQLMKVGAKPDDTPLIPPMTVNQFNKKMLPLIRARAEAKAAKKPTAGEVLPTPPQKKVVKKPPPKKSIKKPAPVKHTPKTLFKDKDISKDEMEIVMNDQKLRTKLLNDPQGVAMLRSAVAKGGPFAKNVKALKDSGWPGAAMRRKEKLKVLMGRKGKMVTVLGGGQHPGQGMSRADAEKLYELAQKI